MTNSQIELGTFDQLIASGGKRRFKNVTLPTSGLVYRIRSLTERELSNYQAVIAVRDDKLREARLATANRRFIALCLVDDQGNTIVPANKVGLLAELDGADSSHLYGECADHCGITTQDLDDLVGNSDETTTSDSPTS